MIQDSDENIALVTGSAGFIGFHVARQLLNEGWSVIGVDALTDYYDVSLKKDREKSLRGYPNYVGINEDITKPGFLKTLFVNAKPNIVVHLAAQAGVRYSLEAPRSYIQSNVVGTFELLEAARHHAPVHMLLASTSSVYGANKKMPFAEIDKADQQVSLYAATKKSTENIAHAYSHLFKIPITMFRFFTVYGPWGRPDMALFKFTKAILNSEPIDLFNYGDMKRDFTYIDDIISVIHRLVDIPPVESSTQKPPLNNTNLDDTPFRIVNIGNSKPIALLTFVNELEKALGKQAEKRFHPMQPGDVYETWCDSSNLDELLGPRLNTDLRHGIRMFIDWYRDYYRM